MVTAHVVISWDGFWIAHTFSTYMLEFEPQTLPKLHFCIENLFRTLLQQSLLQNSCTLLPSLPTADFQFRLNFRMLCEFHGNHTRHRFKENHAKFHNSVQRTEIQMQLYFNTWMLYMVGPCWITCSVAFEVYQPLYDIMWCRITWHTLSHDRESKPGSSLLEQHKPCQNNDSHLSSYQMLTSYV